MIWIIFDVLIMAELCTLSHGSWWADIKFYVWFSANWNKKVALQMLTLPDSQAHEKCSFLVCFQWLNFTSWLLTVFESYYSFCRHFCCLQQKMTPKHMMGCIDPSWQQNIWGMDHFWWTSDDWTLSLVTGQVYTVTKIAEGILLFVKNDNLPNTCWMHLPLPTPNNKVTWKMDHFSCTSNELSVCLFKITFEK